MSKVRANTAISLDGYVAWPNQGEENPLGEGGEQLHEWMLALKAWRESHGEEGGEHSHPPSARPPFAAFPGPSVAPALPLRARVLGGSALHGKQRFERDTAWAMSEENVEVIRRGYEAFNRGDLDGMVADFAPTFEYVATGAIPGSTGGYRGPEGWKEFLGWFWDEFQEARVDVHGLIDAGEQVLAELTLRGRGKKSGAEARWDVWHVWTLRDGKAVHAQGFTKRPDALQAAGLRE